MSIRVRSELRLLINISYGSYESFSWPPRQAYSYCFCGFFYR
jgi:hypothetical protein